MSSLHIVIVVVVNYYYYYYSVLFFSPPYILSLQNAELPGKTDSQSIPYLLAQNMFTSNPREKNVP